MKGAFRNWFKPYICDTQTAAIPPHRKEDEATVEVVGQTHRVTYRDYGESMLVTSEKWIFTDVTKRRHKVLSTANEAYTASQPIHLLEGEKKIIEVCAYFRHSEMTSNIEVGLGTVVSNEYDMKLWGAPLPIGADIETYESGAIGNQTRLLEKTRSV